VSAAELSRVIKARPHPPEHIEVIATAPERAALAERFSISAVESLAATIQLIEDGADITAKGRLVADIVQTCGVSGDDFPVHIDEAIDLRFVPGLTVPDSEEEIELAIDEPDEIEFDGETFDIGEAVAQSLGLAIDPYAVGPEAEIVRKEAGILDESAPSGPLAEALARLKG
jgi:uncharacterized metal-binding protein YceD (DUF177 family)